MSRVGLLTSVRHRVPADAVRGNAIACLLISRVICLCQIHVVGSLVAPVAVVVPSIGLLVVVVVAVVLAAVGITSFVVVVLAIAVVVVLLVVVLLILSIVRLFLSRWWLDCRRRWDSGASSLQLWLLKGRCSSWSRLRAHWSKWWLLSWLRPLFWLGPSLTLLALLLFLPLLAFCSLLRRLLTFLSVSATHIWRKLKLHIHVTSIEII